MRPIELYLLPLRRTASLDLNCSKPVLNALRHPSFALARQTQFFQGVKLEEEFAQLTLIADASEYSWGAYLENSQLAGTWPDQFLPKHELVGNKSCAVSTSTFCQDYTQQSWAAQNRQCYSGELYKQARWDTFPNSVLSDMGDTE